MIWFLLRRLVDGYVCFVFCVCARMNCLVRCVFDAVTTVRFKNRINKWKAKKKSNTTNEKETLWP